LISEASAVTLIWDDLGNPSTLNVTISKTRELPFVTQVANTSGLSGEGGCDSCRQEEKNKNCRETMHIIPHQG
jgi:hypothetical protein